MNIEELNKEANNEEASSDDNIQAAIDEALNAKDDVIEDDTVNEETGELNVLEGEEQEQKKDKDVAKEQEGKEQTPTEPDSKDSEEDVTGQNLVVKDGNLIDPKTDRVVANAGRERRFYEQRELARKQVTESRTQIQRLQSDLTKEQERANVFAEAAKSLHGADPTEVKLGVDIVKGFQTAPVETLKKLLAEALSKGYTIDGITTGMDALIADKLQQDNVTTQATDPEQEALQEVEEFYGRRPDAKLHDGLIAQIVNANPTINLDDAYYALRDSFVSKGLDWNVSLDAQMPKQEQPQEQQKPMPNGSGDVTSNNIVPVNKQTSNSANQSLDDIVRESMKEQGLG